MIKIHVNDGGQKIPRREGGRGTEITTLPGGQNLGELSDIEYFQKKLYRSLGVPNQELLLMVVLIWEDHQRSSVMN